MKNENNSIKQKVMAGAAWKFLERLLSQGASLIVSLVIARILSPSDYGVVSIVNVFIVFANVLVISGLNTALIQKKGADQTDYNTVFTVSLLISVVLYIVLFFAAPLIATIYKQDILVPIIRVLSLILPLYALQSIVCAYVSSTLQFKMFFFATLGGTLVSAVVGILMALSGFGAWALVAQQLTNIVINTLVLFSITKLRLSFCIAFDRLKTLMGYGVRIMISSLLGVTVNQLNPLFIGFKYTTADLSFYTKGRSLPETLSSSMTYTISSVLFPALAKYQDDKSKLLNCTRLYMRVASFIVFPVMLGFFAVSENFVLAFLTEKWLPAVYYIQVVCIATMFDVVAVGNCETIKAMGRSDVFLKIEIAKKTGYFVTLVLFLIFTNTPQALAVSLLVCTIIQVVINSIPNVKLIDYKIKSQLSDILPNLLTSIVMCFAVFCLGRLSYSPTLLLVLQILVGGLIYVILAIIFRNPSLRYIVDMVKKRND